MTRPMDQHSEALDRAQRHALDWLSSLEDRPVPRQASIDQVNQTRGSASRPTATSLDPARIGQPPDQLVVVDQARAALLTALLASDPGQPSGSNVAVKWRRAGGSSTMR